jgi:hypothetical protein
MHDWSFGNGSAVLACAQRTRFTSKLGRMRYLVIVALGLIGDPFHLIRVWLSLLVGAGLVAVVYWFSLPQVLPIWPGVATLLVAAVAGVAWEIHASSNTDRLR